MASNVTLSSGIRANLLALQNTSSLLSTTQSHLSTGKKVNSSLDNPLNFLTSSRLDQRSSALSGLLDGFSNSIQTIQAASKGIDSITTTLKSLKAQVQQARGDNTSVITPSDKTLTAANAGTAQNNKISFNIGSGTSVAITINDGTNNLSNSTIANNINTNVTLAGKVSAKVNTDGNLVISNLTSSSITTAGIGTTGLVGDTTAGTLTPGTPGATSAIRQASLVAYNNLLSQIDSTAKDASFNGQNLLNGDAITTRFNEKGTSSLETKAKEANGDVFGAVNSAKLGLTVKVAADFADNGTLDTLNNNVEAALDKISALGNGFSSDLGIIQNRQDFSKGIIDILSTGSANLVNADQNEEAVTQLALQTRQSISQSALSLANQADQGVLQLLR